MKTVNQICSFLIVGLIFITTYKCSPGNDAPTITLPILTTAAITNITSSGATSGGNITNDGNAAVTERGIVYATKQTPTTADTKVGAGTGTGSFTSNMTGLTASTIYFVRAYAINSLGTAYGSQETFTSSMSLSPATVTTSAPTNLTSTGVTLGGNVTSDGNATISERGVVYATTQTPTTSNTKVAIGNGTGIFTSNITGLTANTIYYIRAYAINSQGTAYGNQETFTTSLALSLSTVTTTVATNISATGATLGGNVTSDGNATVSERGVVYATTQTPTTANAKVANGTGTGIFSSNVTGLTAGTVYYVRAYAINSQGTAYGSQQSFTTGLIITQATVTTTIATSITSSAATLGGNVTSDGNATVTERGIVYATTPTPTTSNDKVAIGTGTGNFSTNVTGLNSGTTYYVRAYAINSEGTAYGNQETFSCSLPLSMAVVTTNVPNNISTGGATLWGNVTSDGNAAVTERGIVYATTPNPTTSNMKVVIGTGTGIFTSAVTGLISGTTYYVRAYAINSQGTAYGNQESFTTGLIITLASVTTTIATNVTSTGATVGGNVTNDGNSTVTIRGVVYATTQNPTTSDARVSVGSGIGSYSTNITGLTSGTTYYLRAYAVNSQGTGYGETISFTTAAVIPLAPTGVTAYTAANQSIIGWSAVNGATSYNIYWSITAGVNKANGTKITGITSPYTHTGRTNFTTYYYVVTAVNSAGESVESAVISAVPQPTDTGSGGISTSYISNGVKYALHTFTSDANFNPPANLTHVRVLLVGAGGNGGGLDFNTSDWGTGGGGGGGQVKDIDISISGTTMAVSVAGQGGSSNTTFGGQSVANGTNGNIWYYQTINGSTSLIGGDGGKSGNGLSGGIGVTRAGGGGAGAAQKGSDGIPDTWNPIGGNGGDGLSSNITGFSVVYGGGGGGGGWTGYSGKNGSGGLGGGGGEAKRDGAANTGGGGFGATYTSGGGYSNYWAPGKGGSGVVIISYPIY
jgi:hypothetical protein